MALRLATGGKALLVLSGLGLIVLGLWYGGILLPAAPSEVDEGTHEPDDAMAPSTSQALPEHEAGLHGDEREDPSPEKQSPSEQHLPAPDEVVPPEPSTPDEPEASPEVPKTSEGTWPLNDGVEVPPLFAESGSSLRMARSADGRDAPRLLRELEGGMADIIEIELHDVVDNAPRALSAVVVGARAPSREVFFCGDEDPIETLREQSRIAVKSSGHRLLVGHVAAVKEVDVARLTWLDDGRDSSPDLFVTMDPSDEADCVSLLAVGAQGPTLLLAREMDARLYGKSYSEAAEALANGDASLGGYLLSAEEGRGGYERQAWFMSTIRSRLTDSAFVSPPRTAEWIVRGSGR